ncbi:MAG TPA: GTP cyclohydrolase II RibA, partial [Pseudolabrys sp.]|nr:GTP cyclohydrolase II RibA [Pseudolabrys sp.]
MSAFRTSASSKLFGSKGHTSVSRGLAEYHARRPVLINWVNGVSETLLTLPVEGLDAQRLGEFLTLCAPAVPELIITAQRALALGINASTPMALQLSSGADARSILALVGNTGSERVPPATPAGHFAAAAIQLVKLSQGLPAVLAAKVSPADLAACDPKIITVDADAVGRFADEAVKSLTLASEAPVPLDSGTRTRFVVFRDALGGSPVAIIVGKPDFSKPVPVRLHSACLTGDVFGSRRCDCGDQLKLALRRLEDLGGGIIIYLAQEGRGLGLANKMRTYEMQDEGLDTVDANTTLGFDDDERDYGVAARMLQMLECPRIVLLTNNPTKLDGLAKAGIEIAGRMSLETPINSDNVR